MINPHPLCSIHQLVGAVTQLVSRLPSFPCRVLAFRESVPNGLCGSYVSLSGESTEHIVGLLSHPLGWESLSRALDRDLPLGESRGLVDGACEMATIVAEAFRGRLPEGSISSVGLPLFVEGMVAGGRRIDLQAADVSFGGSLVLVVLFSRQLETASVARSSGSELSGGAV